MTERGGRFRLAPHTADVRLRLEAVSWRGLLRAAVRGLAAAAGVGAVPGGPRAAAAVSLEGASREELLVDWLNELAYRVWTEGWVPEGVEFSEASGRRVRARLEGRRLDGAPAKEIKAASYHGLRVASRRGRWTATVILDV